MGDEEIVRAVAQEIRNQAANYMADNSWFRFYSPVGGEPMTPDKYAEAAGRAYVHVKKATVPLLLGDTKLRSDQEITDNFGLSDAEAARAAANPAPSRPAIPAVPVAGSSVPSAAVSARPPGSPNPPSAAAPGAVLSNVKWSPMLNDAFILGGIKHKKQFVFTPVGDDLSFIQSIAPSASSSPAATKEQQIQAGMSVWKSFFLTKTYQLWDRGFPRVFARELLGLKKFGYKAAPTATNLSFDCPLPDPPPNVTFAAYLSYLSNECHFQEPNKQKVLEEIGEFLFNDKNALAPIWTGVGAR
jgi:hypothetical protein